MSVRGAAGNEAITVSGKDYFAEFVLNVAQSKGLQ
jgi:hypothetical protein